MRIETPGGYAGPWDPTITPYIVEPMDLLKSRKYRAVVVVAPARCGKTQGLLDGWLSHSVTADPGDMGMYFSTRNLAHDFRKRRIDRLHTRSPQMRGKLSRRAHDTTIELIVYRHGMMLNLGWPTSSQLAQRDLRYVAMTDYDSFPDDVGGEGSPFDMGAKRIQVAMSAGMALVESSPKRAITVPNWQPRTPHEAPPTDGGILPLYNRGDRRRWYWQCIDGCGQWFEAPALPAYEEHDDPSEAAKTAHVACPHCGEVYRQGRKKALNASGQWLAENVSIDEQGRHSGSGPDTDIASFWMLGCAAAFQTWASLVQNQIVAERYADASGDETSLAATRNVDQGMPHRPAALDAVQGPEYLAQRERTQVDRGKVPPGVLVLLASVDVQNNRFEVAIWGHCKYNERHLVDRFAIRELPDGNLIRPAAVLEHWDEITEQVVKAKYGNFSVYATAVDSGGREGMTTRAYDWWRRLRRDGLSHKVFLVKGEGGKQTQPMVRKTFPDSRKRRDRNSGSRGDIPVLAINADKVKDACHADLKRDIPGPGYVHFPEWTPDYVYEELTSEQRTMKGWVPLLNRRNETWDLFAYDRALWAFLGGDGVEWDRPPRWLRPNLDTSPRPVRRYDQPSQRRLLVR